MGLNISEFIKEPKKTLMVARPPGIGARTASQLFLIEMEDLRKSGEITEGMKLPVHTNQDDVEFFENVVDTLDEIFPDCFPVDEHGYPLVAVDDTEEDWDDWDEENTPGFMQKFVDTDNDGWDDDLDDDEW